MKHGIAVQVAVRVPESTECDLIGVPQKPGGLVIEGGRAFFEGSDAKQDTETTALGT